MKQNIRIKKLCILSILFFQFACNRNLDTPTDNEIQISESNLDFNTIITATQTPTLYTTIHNTTGKTVTVTSAILAGGANSPFKLNLNGQVGFEFRNIEIRPFDSVYLFAKAVIPASQGLAYQTYSDSIVLMHQGQSQIIKFSVSAIHAIRYTDTTFSTSLQWNSDKPILLSGKITVAENTVLKIAKGTNIYCKPGTLICINGSLIANGMSDSISRIVFRGSRFDAPYKVLPGLWKGIIFGNKSKNNFLNSTDIFQAIHAIVVAGDPRTVLPDITLNGCNLEHASITALQADHCKLSCTNCIIGQNGGTAPTDTAIVAGANLNLGLGNFEFNHCNFINFESQYIRVSVPSITIAPKNIAVEAKLSVIFKNCIFATDAQNGSQSLQVLNAPSNSTLRFENCLLPTGNFSPFTFENCIVGIPANFEKIERDKSDFNFKIISGSPCIDAAKPSSVTLDFFGNMRPLGIKPDIGYFEKE